MKYNNASGFRTRKRVAPHWGAWIEIDCVGLFDFVMAVAPHWGAWIEITVAGRTITRRRRTPLGCVD